MTVKNLIDAIAEALFQEFGSGHEIYTEKVEQGLEEGCFLVRCVNPTKNVDLDIRYKRTNQFVIQYIPSTAEENDECLSVLEKLFDCLEYVILSEMPVRGTEMHGEITDGILNFMVNYDGFVMKERSETNMEDLDVLTEAKG